MDKAETHATPASLLPRNANEFIEQQLDERIMTIESKYKAHAICFVGPIVSGVDDIIQLAIEKRRSELPHVENLSSCLQQREDISKLFTG
jgi:hypothetical protein